MRMEVNGSSGRGKLIQYRVKRRGPYFYLSWFFYSFLFSFFEFFKEISKIILFLSPIALIFFFLNSFIPEKIIPERTLTVSVYLIAGSYFFLLNEEKLIRKMINVRDYKDLQEQPD